MRRDAVLRQRRVQRAAQPRPLKPIVSPKESLFWEERDSVVDETLLTKEVKTLSNAAFCSRRRSAGGAWCGGAALSAASRALAATEATSRAAPYLPPTYSAANLRSCFQQYPESYGSSLRFGSE